MKKNLLFIKYERESLISRVCIINIQTKLIENDEVSKNVAKYGLHKIG